MESRENDLLFRAFADRRRLRILSLLRRGEMCVGDLVAILRLPQSTVSRQVGILRQAGLVACREDGMWRHYSLAEPGTPLHKRLVGCLADCFADVGELTRDALAAERLATHGGCCTPSCGPSCASARDATPAPGIEKQGGLVSLTPRKTAPPSRRAGGRTTAGGRRAPRSRGR